MAEFERIDALARMVREMGVNREVILSSIHEGLIRASEREYGEPLEYRVTWEQGTGDVRMEALKTIVDKVERGMGHAQISLQAAHRIDAALEPGEKAPVKVNINDFGRAAVAVFRREFLSLVQAAEREQVLKEFGDRIGCIIPRCKVQQVYRNRILVQVAGRIEAEVPERERSRGERFEQGDSINPILIDIRPPQSNEPQLILSRATPDLVKRLFEREAPEIEEGQVVIELIAREAGVRTKIAVRSNDIRIDAVGAFVGMKGSRVQSVMRELNGERIDIIPFTHDMKTLASSALTPARVIHIENAGTVQDEVLERSIPRLVAVVPDDEHLQAIGKRGHNVRLAGELAGCRIDLKTQSQWEEENYWETKLSVDSRELPSVGDKLAERLRLQGLDTANAILEADRETLLSVQGVGPVVLAQILEDARQAIKERNRQVNAEKRLKEESLAEEAIRNGFTEEECGGDRKAGGVLD
jgi:N utilization substance protein A